MASFFPHFRLVPPPTLTVRVCRDTSCHLAGAGAVLEELGALANDKVHVEGVSCLGRCDRAPAACVELHRVFQGLAENGGKQDTAPSVHGNGGSDDRHVEEERFYLGRPAPDLAKFLRTVVQRCGEGKKSLPRHSDFDRDLAASDKGQRYADGGTPPAPNPATATNGDKTRYPAEGWLIDPYAGKERNYAAASKAIQSHRQAFRRACEKLHEQLGWPLERVELFGAAMMLGHLVDVPLDKPMQEALRAWQTEDDWASGPELGGWSELLLKELDKKTKVNGQEIRHADLRGMGRAGIPATQKWRDVRDAVRAARRNRTGDDRAFIVVNGDESEPATFKDRELLLHYPHLVIEGVILAGLITDATQGFIYIRHEYPEQIEACRSELKRAEESGVFRRVAAVRGRPFPVEVFVSPGGYICGEQSALIEAMSDRRAEPRNMPPKLETNGLEDRPTLSRNA